MPYHTLTIRSGDDRTFRIEDVGPARVVRDAQYSAAAESVHTIRIRLNWKEASQEKTPRVVIRTDDPEQPTLELPVLKVNVEG
jgi:hypothetical protein